MIFNIFVFSPANAPIWMQMSRRENCSFVRLWDAKYDHTTFENYETETAAHLQIYIFESLSRLNFTVRHIRMPEIEEMNEQARNIWTDLVHYPIGAQKHSAAKERMWKRKVRTEHAALPRRPTIAKHSIWCNWDFSNVSQSTPFKPTNPAFIARVCVCLWWIYLKIMPSKFDSIRSVWSRPATLRAIHCLRSTFFPNRFWPFRTQSIGNAKILMNKFQIWTSYSRTLRLPLTHRRRNVRQKKKKLNKAACVCASVAYIFSGLL